MKKLFKVVLSKSDIKKDGMLCLDSTDQDSDLGIKLSSTHNHQHYECYNLSIRTLEDNVVFSILCDDMHQSFLLDYVKEYNSGNIIKHVLMDDNYNISLVKTSWNRIEMFDTMQEMCEANSFPISKMIDWFIKKYT